jgi:hypothetical protein
VGSEHSNLGRGINGLLQRLQPRNDLFPSSIAVSVAVEGDLSIPTLPMESMLSPTVCNLEMIYSHSTTAVVSSLPEPDQSIPHLAVESMLSSRGCKAEMISPLSVECFRVDSYQTMC